MHLGRFDFQRVRIWQYGPQNRCNSLIKGRQIGRINTRLMSSRLIAICRHCACCANGMHFVVESQKTATPTPGGGSIFFTPHGYQSLPQSSIHACRIDKIGNTDNDAPEYEFFEILSRNMLILDFEVIEHSFVVVLCC